MIASATIGIVTSAVATIYFVWMLYNDWQPRERLASLRQLLWSLIHFPFHLTLILFVGGSSQFIMWWKITDVISKLPWDDLVQITPDGFTNTKNVTKDYFIANVMNWTIEICAQFPPRNWYTVLDLVRIEESLYNISDAFWSNATDSSGQSSLLYADDLQKFNRTISSLEATIENSLFATFDINSFEDFKEHDINLDADQVYDFELSVLNTTVSRFFLVVSTQTSIPKRPLPRDSEALLLIVSLGGGQRFNESPG